ncbi:MULTISPECIES: ATPase [unclassified Psychrobacter]|uniref:ATPase n=1 Tax=unclassified Psychrobacter TaxID=196806 RepID=UPI003FD15D29
MSKKHNKKNKQTVSEQLSQKVVDARLTPNPLNHVFMDEETLRLALVTAQYALRATRQESPPSSNQPTGLLVLVNGMEQAGKGSAVKQLRQWVDPRLLKVEATIGYPPLAYQPLWQAHTKAMPRHGDVMVYFGNWYADLLYQVMLMATQYKEASDAQHDTATKRHFQSLPDKGWQDYLSEQLVALKSFEDDLALNQTKLLKCWFHIDAETLKKRLTDKEADPAYLYQIDWSDSEVLEQFNQVAAVLLQQQDDWVVIDGSDKDKATTLFCHEVLEAMQTALIASRPIDDNNQQVKDDTCISSDTTQQTICTPVPFELAKISEQLTDIDDDNIDKAKYRKQLKDKQERLAKLLRARGGRHVVFAFEGIDAAGKGGAIKRLVAPLDPREYQVYNIGAPMLYELQHPYLWRFWTRLPNEQTDRISRIAIFDRTWYGRVLVERVEQFATDRQWQRAYEEINRFEADLMAAGTLVIKYWLVIDNDEQLKRFEAREKTPHKQFKLTDDDWRNREKWSEYLQAAADMLARTDTEVAPWHVIATNHKRVARLQVLDHAIEQLSAYANE